MGAPLRQRLGREVAKGILSPLLGWKPLENPLPGYTIVLGVPWDLRHLLPVNLRFLARTKLDGLHRIKVVFDRRYRPEMDAVIARAKAEHPELPLDFRFYPPISGWLVERFDISTFYNSMNTVLALGECETKYAILHDFDLYPLVEDYFEAIPRAMEERNLRFSGLELTPYDGLTEDDGLIGTWCLGIDVPWIRQNYKPIQCFHKIARVGDRDINLDPYSWIQTQTPKAERALVGTFGGEDVAHVKNLCSTYLRFVTGRWAKLVWRLHFIWYLEKLSGDDTNFREAIRQMAGATIPILNIGDREADFTGTDPGAAGFLAHEVSRMEDALLGHVRPEVQEYLDGFSRLLAL